MKNLKVSISVIGFFQKIATSSRGQREIFFWHIELTAPPGEKILRMALHACIICIPNSMVLSAILEKHAQGQEFSKSERRRKYHECMFFQIA
jgi:hypothetical protein